MEIYDLNKAAWDTAVSKGSNSYTAVVSPEQVAQAKQGKWFLYRPYRYFGDAQTAWELYQRALEIARALGDRVRERGKLHHLGTTASQLGDDQGIGFYQAQLAIIRERGDLEIEADVLQLLSFAYLSIGNNQALLDLYEVYIPLLQRLERWEDVVYAQIGQASLYYSILSQPEQAFSLLDQALAIAQQQNQPQLIRAVLVNQAIFYRLSGNTEKVLMLYQQALAYTDQNLNYQDRLILQQQLAYAYEAHNRVPDSIPLLQANLELARRHENAMWTAWSMDDLGFAYWQLQDYPQALAWQQQALEQHRSINPQSGNPFNEAQAYNRLGWIYWAMNNLPAAEQALRLALENYETVALNAQENQGLFSQSNDDLQVNLREGFADAHSGLQGVLVDQGKAATALEVAEQGRARSIINLLFRMLPRQN